MNGRLTAWGGSLLLHGILLGSILLLATRFNKPLAVEILSFDLVSLDPPQQSLTARKKAAPEPKTPEPIRKTQLRPAPEPVVAEAPAQLAPQEAPTESANEMAETADSLAEEIAPTTGGESQQDELRAHYLSAQFRYIRERIFTHLDYPAIARRRGWEGQVKLCFTVLESGEIEELEVTESSGHALLDRQAVKAVEAAAPFPPPPCPAEIRLPVTFALR